MARSDGGDGSLISGDSSLIAVAPTCVIGESLALHIREFVAKIRFQSCTPLGSRRGFEDLHDRDCDDDGAVVIDAAALG
jgi:hypothetical protein